MSLIRLPEILTHEPLNTGLTNQKMAIIGLSTIAEERGARVALRHRLVDFYYDGERYQHVELPIDAAFDVVGLRHAIGAILTDEAPTETIALNTCFSRGAAALKRAPIESRAARIMQGFAPSEPLERVATKAWEWLLSIAADRPSQIAAIHLRIERNWLNYLNIRAANGAPGLDLAREMADPSAIFAKLRATPELSDISILWACCDEADLLHGKTELKGLALEFGYRLIFKSDLPDAVGMPDTALFRSIVDFRLASGMPAYVGLNMSSFSRSLVQAARWAQSASSLYFYDIASTQAVRRWPRQRKQRRA